MSFEIVRDHLGGFGGKHYYIPETESTMDDARKLVKLGALNGFAIQAGFQTKGRGRNTGKVWNAAANENLLITFGFYAKPPNSLRNRFGFLVALSFARLLEEKFALPVEIKWPNDVLVHGKKIAGILGEIEGDWVYIGMGANIGQAVFSDELKTKAASLRTLGADVPSAREQVEPLALRIYESCLDTQWCSAINFRLFRRGQFMRLKRADGRLEVVKIGRMNEQGGLQIENEDGESEILVSGELLSFEYAN